MAKEKENKATTETNNAEKAVTAPEKAKEIDWNEKVPLLIRRDPTNLKETDFCICVNGTIFQVQRDIEVMVPRYVKQAYLDSVAQLTRAYDNQITASEAQGQD